MTPEAPSRRDDIDDITRQVATVIGALAQCALPALLLSRRRPTLRPPETVQPAPWAFAIWLPIYGTSFVYAAYQARRSLRDQPLLREVGRPLAGAYLALGAWAPLLVKERYWSAQAALAAAAGLAGTARHRLAATDAEGLLTSSERAVLVAPVGMLAGWSAAAAGVNLSAMVVGKGPLRTRRSGEIAGAAILLGLGGVGGLTVTTDGSATATGRVYGGTLLWALVGVFFGRRKVSTPLAVTALVAAIPVVGALSRRRRTTGR